MHKNLMNKSHQQVGFVVVVDVDIAVVVVIFVVDVFVDVMSPASKATFICTEILAQRVNLKARLLRWFCRAQRQLWWCNFFV